MTQIQPLQSPVMHGLEIFLSQYCPKEITRQQAKDMELPLSMEELCTAIKKKAKAQDPITPVLQMLLGHFIF